MTEKLYCTCCGRFIPGGGLRVYATLLCRACESRITRLKVDDPDYACWLKKIQSLWDRWEQAMKEAQKESGQPTP